MKIVIPNFFLQNVKFLSFQTSQPAHISQWSHRLHAVQPEVQQQQHQKHFSLLSCDGWKWYPPVSLFSITIHIHSTYAELQKMNTAFKFIPLYTFRVQCLGTVVYSSLTSITHDILMETGVFEHMLIPILSTHHPDILVCSTEIRDKMCKKEHVIFQMHSLGPNII